MHINKTRELFLLVVLVVFIILFSFLSTNKDANIDITKKSSGSPSPVDTFVVKNAEQDSKTDVSFSREIPKDIKGSNALIILRLSYPTPKSIDIYEKLPSGFSINNQGTNLEFTKLNDNTYLFQIPRMNRVLGNAIIYNLEIDESIKSGTYEISGYIEVNNKKEETPVSNLVVL